MNYIKLVNWFWENVIYLDGYKSDYGILFFSIVDSINKNEWKPTEIEYDRIINKSKIGKRMYLDARNWLCNNNVITFEAGKNEFARAKFSIVSSVQYCTSSEPLLRLSSTSSEPVEHLNDSSNAPSIDKQLNNKTINKETNKQPANRRANIFSDLFTAWFKNKFELSYSMKTKDFVGIATIEKYCKENAKGEPIEMFKFILDNYDALPEFYQTNINPSFIASRISEIASMLKKQHTKTQIVKQVENEPVNRKWFPSPSQYYSECITKKQEPFNFWTGNEMTEDEKISEYKIHKVGEYRYA